MADRSSFDLFAFLSRMNARDQLAYSKLQDDAKKAAAPLVIMRWLSGTSDPAQIIRINQFVNPYIFSLGKEPELLFKLMASSCTGKVSRVNWLKGPSGTGNRLAVKAVMEHYELSSREASEYLMVMSPADVVSCAESLGWEKDQIKKLSTELGHDNDVGSRPAKKSSGKPKK